MLDGGVGGVTHEGRGVERRPRGSCINTVCVYVCILKPSLFECTRAHAIVTVCVSPSPFKLKGLYLACVYIYIRAKCPLSRSVSRDLAGPPPRRSKNSYIYIVLYTIIYVYYTILQYRKLFIRGWVF